MSGHKDSDGGWRNFIWNSEKKEFLGRTGGSWCKYSIFLSSERQSNTEILEILETIFSLRVDTQHLLELAVCSDTYES